MLSKVVIILLQIELFISKTLTPVFHRLFGNFCKKIQWKIDFIRSLRFCLKYLPYEQAIRVPIKVEHGVKVLQLRKGQIKIENIVERYQIILGESPTLFLPPELQKTVLLCKKNGELIFKGKAKVSKGCVLHADEDSKIIFGDDFYCNRNVFIRSNNLVSFGQTCSVGWNVTFNTTDGHVIKKNGDFIVGSAPIIIGDKVWIASYCLIGKGTEIADHCIIGQGSVVVHEQFTNPYSIIHGVAAKEGTGRYERVDF